MEGLLRSWAPTAGLTAFYSFRMLGLVFFGKSSAKLEEVERQGHHVHEPGPLMWIPYSILAAVTVLIGLVALAGQAIPALNVQGTLESAAASYIHGLFPSQSVQSLLPASSGIDAASSGVTGLFVAVGFLAAAGIYVANKVRAERFVGQTGFMHGLHVFLEKRWYINAVYYKVFVNAPIAASGWLSETLDNRVLFRVNSAGSILGTSFSTAGMWVDSNVVDAFANGVSTVGQALSRAARRLQTGVTEQYAQVFALGIIVMVVLLLLALGVGLP